MDGTMYRRIVEYLDWRSGGVVGRRIWESVLRISRSVNWRIGDSPSRTQGDPKPGTATSAIDNRRALYPLCHMGWFRRSANGWIDVSANRWIAGSAERWSGGSAGRRRWESVFRIGRSVDWWIGDSRKVEEEGCAHPNTHMISMAPAQG